jgi:polar amino acid transport system substrate-binding protein
MLGKSKPATALCLLLVGGLLAACGSSKSPSSGTSSSPSTSASAGGYDPAAAALVPAALKSKGTLLIATDASYAPDEFYAANGHTIIGWDPDLAVALGQVLGLRVRVVNVTFNAIIAGLQAGRYDLSLSSFTDTKAREKKVDFVTYANVGTSFFERTSGGPTVNSLADLCGLKVSVESGTTEETDASTQSAKCVHEGKKKVQLQPYSTQSQANLALAEGRADVGMADQPVAGYQVAKSNGRFRLEGPPYGTAPYGIAIPKTPGLAPAILAALKDLIHGGTYTRLLTKWGLQSIGIMTPIINGATS